VIFIGIGLAMDAFAVSVCKGLMSKEKLVIVGLTTGIWFGAFQAIMPIIGFYLGSAVYDIVSEYAHWVAFAILLLIGANMIREDFFGDEDQDGSLGTMTMVTLAIATSIDALIVGVSMSMESDEILLPAVLIGVITFFISFLGAVLGRHYGDRFGRHAGTLGGILLIIIGIKTLLDGLGYLRGLQGPA